MFKSILVPVDFSSGSEHALRVAVRLARANGGTLTLLHVGPVKGLPPVTLPDDMTVLPTLAERYEEIATEHLHTLERLARQEVPEDVPWRTRLRDGNPPEEIVAEAAESAYDVVVMGTHGRSGLAHLVLGSVTERVLRLSSIPVLVTR